MLCFSPYTKPRFSGLVYHSNFRRHAFRFSWEMSRPVDALRAAIVPRPLDGMRLNAVSSTGLKPPSNHF